MSYPEFAYLRPPFESLTKITRNAQKIVAKDAVATSKYMEQLVSACKSKKLLLESVEGQARVRRTLETVTAQLVGMKKKLLEYQNLGSKQLVKVSARLQHIEESAMATEVHGSVIAKACTQGGGNDQMSTIGAEEEGEEEGERQHIDNIKEEEDDVKMRKKQEANVFTNGPRTISAGGAGGGTWDKDAGRNGNQRSADKGAIRSENAGDSSLSGEKAVRVFNRRIDCMIADHLLRQGYYSCAEAFIQRADIKELVDADLFVSAKRVLRALQQRDCSLAFIWCTANKSQLAKINSSLELHLRVQEYVDLLKTNLVGQAIEYAQLYLSPFMATNSDIIAEVLTIPVYLPHFDALSKGLQEAAPWKKLQKYLTDDRWRELLDHFQYDFYAVNGMLKHSILTVVLQTGLSSLKSPFCARAGRGGGRARRYGQGRQWSTALLQKEPHRKPLWLEYGTHDHAHFNHTKCPVCTTPMSFLAKCLPVSVRTQSRLVCRLSGSLMDESNPPLALPNGHVYGRNSLYALAKDNGGCIICPRSKAKFTISQCIPVYIL